VFIYFIPHFVALLGGISKRDLSLVGLLLVLFFVSLKGSVDPDYYNYQYLYVLVSESVESFPFSNNEQLRFEWFFLFLLSVLNAAGLDFQIFYFVYGLLSVYFIFMIVRSVSDKNSNFMFLYLYVLSFIGLWVQVRFGLASLVLLFSVILFFKGNYFKSFITFVFSLLNHTSVLAVILPVFVYFILSFVKFNRVFLTLSLLLLSFVSLFDFVGFFKWLLAFYNPRYSNYFIEESGSMISYFVRVGFLFVMIFFLRKNLNEISRLSKFLLSMCFSSVIIFLLASKISIMYRVGVIFEMGYLLFFLRDNYAVQSKYIAALFFMLGFVLYRSMDFFVVLDPYFFYLDFSEWF